MKAFKWTVGILIAVLLLGVVIWMFIEIFINLVIMIVALWALAGMIGYLSELMNS